MDSHRRRLPTVGSRVDRFGQYLADWRRTSVPYVFRLETDIWRSKIAEVAPAFDAAFCRHSFMADVVADFPRGRVIIDADDLQYIGMRRSVQRLVFGWGTPMAGLEAGRMFRYEQNLFRGAAQTLVCSEGDFKRVRSSRKTLVRNGVDLPGADAVSRPSNPNVMAFVGTFTYGPNVEGLKWFLQAVWPRLRK